VTTESLNRQLETGRKLAMGLEPQLTAVYAAQFRKIARYASARFRQLAVVKPVTAAGDEDNPDWVPPDVDELLNQPLDDARAEKAATDLHLQAIELATPKAVKALPGVSFEASSPFAAPLLEATGTKSVNLGLAARDVILKVIGESYQAGLSVPATAAALQTQIADLADTTALMQARTDLNGLANGASLQSVQVLGDDAPQTKVWLATEDERTRETHADADGQEVPIDQPFQVGDDLLMYPGDPDGSDAEVINCRCTLTYSDNVNATEEADVTASADLVKEDRMRTFAASGDTGLPLSDRDTAWDAGEATGRVKKWASSDGSGDPSKIDYDKLGRAYFWRDAASADGPKIGDFKLPFADIIGGKLTAVWRGITAGAARLDQTEGIDRGAVKAKMRTYYSKAAKQYDDDSIKAPFAAQTSGCANCEHAFADHLGSAGPCTMANCDCNGWESMTASYTPPEIGVLTAAAGDPIPWRAVLIVEGEETADGRIIDPGAITWRPLPLTLMSMLETDEGHDGAIVAGRIDAIYRDPMMFDDGRIAIVGEGVFDTGEWGAETARLVADQTLRGVSADLGSVEMELRPKPVPVFDTGDIYDPDQDGDIDGPAEVEDLDDYLLAYTAGTLMGATVCPFPAIGSGNIEIAEPVVAAGSFGYGNTVVVRVTGPGLEPVEMPGLTAAAAGATPAAPPADWFEDPKLDGPTPLSIGDDGRLVGHVATWNTCHIGNPQGPNVCTTAPRDRSGYALFHLGELITAEGDAISVGQITLDTDHAPLGLAANASQRHYADTGAAAAYIRCGMDAFGIWAAGAVADELPVTKIRKLRAAKLSGDWRTINGRHEMIGVLAVNVPGFPIPRPAAGLRASADGAEMLALVAAGILGETPASEEQNRARIAALAARALGRDELIALALGADE
jgi:Phage Mu protein F like protein